jgi:hypothetical protein
VSSEFQNTALENITLIPNPTTGELTIDNGQLTINSIEVFDIYGRKLSSHHLIPTSSHHLIPTSSHHLIPTPPHHLINISHLQPGIYFVKIKTEAGEIVKKVIKQ